MSPSRKYQGPSVDSPEFLRRAERIPASPDADQATVQTIREMVKHIHTAAQDPVLQQFALDGVEGWRGGMEFASSGLDPFSSPVAIAESCFWQAKHHMRFLHHSKQIFILLNERDQLQLLISPDVLVRMKKMRGDCAIYTMLLCAMLEALGVVWEIQTVAVNPYQPTVFSHVFLRVVLPDGRRIPLDASHGKYLGWMVPDSDILRSQVWNMSGEPVADRAQFSGLQGYMPNPNPWWNSGFGQLDDSGAPMDPTSDTALPPIDTLPSGSTLQDLTGQGGTMGPPVLPGISTTTVGSTPGYVAPSQSSTAWANFATALAKSGMTLAEINSIQPGTVVSANGAILRQATGLPVPVGTGTSLTTAFAGSGNLLMIGGVVIAGLFAVSALKK